MQSTLRRFFPVEQPLLGLAVHLLYNHALALWLVQVWGVDLQQLAMVFRERLSDWGLTLRTRTSSWLEVEL